jgi:hypothetical protein
LPHNKALSPVHLEEIRKFDAVSAAIEAPAIGAALLLQAGVVLGQDNGSVL